MVFVGLRDVSEGLLFAQQAFKNMATEVGIKEMQAHHKMLNSKIKLFFADNLPVPQARVTKMINDLVREIYLSQNKEVS
jgi:hypothetical protein